MIDPTEHRNTDLFFCGLCLQAAKLDPHNSETFEYLGHYYSEVGGDMSRARKCHQKAFDLDNQNEAAGEKLCDLLKQEGEEVSKSCQGMGLPKHLCTI